MTKFDSQALCQNNASIRVSGLNNLVTPYLIHFQLLKGNTADVTCLYFVFYNFSSLVLQLLHAVCTILSKFTLTINQICAE